MRRCLTLFIVAFTAGCSRYDPPPAHMVFGGLPVSGSLADARQAGFTRCIELGTTLRCRRNDVMFLGHGPYDAAVDLRGGDGRGGFDQLTIWHDRNQDAVFAVVDALEDSGWTTCATGVEDRGDQQIYTRPGEPVRLSMDLSYWGKRRLRVIPEWNNRDRRCEALGPTQQNAPPLRKRRSTSNE